MLKWRPYWELAQDEARAEMLNAVEELADAAPRPQDPSDGGPYRGASDPSDRCLSCGRPWEVPPMTRYCRRISNVLASSTVFAFALSSSWRITSAVDSVVMVLMLCLSRLP